MPDQEETLDVGKAIELLNKALRLQFRSVIQHTLSAGNLTGFETQALADSLGNFAREEADDARRLAEKIGALGGTPTTEIAEVRVSSDPREAIDWLIESEGEAIEALQAAIEPTGREGTSEALEHRLEHMIMRKQEQVDTLVRARGS